MEKKDPPKVMSFFELASRFSIDNNGKVGWWNATHNHVSPSVAKTFNNHDITKELPINHIKCLLNIKLNHHPFGLGTEVEINQLTSNQGGHLPATKASWFMGIVQGRTFLSLSDNTRAITLCNSSLWKKHYWAKTSKISLFFALLCNHQLDHHV